MKLGLGLYKNLALPGILMSQCGGTGLMYRTYRCVRYGVYFNELSEVSGTGIDVVRYRYQLWYRRPYRYRRCRH